MFNLHDRVEVLPEEYNGMQKIKLLEEPYSGIIMSYGKVSFDEDTPTLRFEYDIHVKNGKEYDKAAFEQYLGDTLVMFIEWGLKENSLTYTGGIDENRTGDPIEPDSQ